LATAKKCKHCGEMLDAQLRAAEPPLAPAPPASFNFDAPDASQYEQPEQPVYEKRDERSNRGARMVLSGITGAVLLAVVGLVSSQYFPVFGGIIEKALATPWSQVRLTLIPAHVFIFAVVGAFFGGAIGFQSSGNRHRSSGAAVLWMVALVFVIGGGAALYYVLSQGGVDVRQAFGLPMPVEEFASAYTESPGEYKGKDVTIKGHVPPLFYEGDPVMTPFPGSPDAGKPIPKQVMVRKNLRFSSWTGTVRCEFPKDGRKALQELEEGELVTVKGTCRGKAPDGTILIENCSLVKK